MERLLQREQERFGERILLGGDMYEQSQAFLAWAASYDEGGLDIRSRRLHEEVVCSENINGVGVDFGVFCPCYAHAIFVHTNGAQHVVSFTLSPP